MYGILSRLRVVFSRGLCGSFCGPNLVTKTTHDVDVAAIAHADFARVRIADHDATKVVATPSCLSEAHT